MCGGCGHPLEVSTAKENQLAYAAEIVRCHACAAKERAAKKFADDGGDSAGAMTRMTKYPRT